MFNPVNISGDGDFYIRLRNVTIVGWFTTYIIILLHVSAVRPSSGRKYIIS
jgi:hypothetical protein